MYFIHQNTISGLENVGYEILTRSLEFQDRASEHRLNQPPHRQSPALQAATATKEKLVALKKQNKADTITVEMSLFIFPANGTKAKKVCSKISLYCITAIDMFLVQTQLLPLLKKFFGCDPSTDVFRYAKTELKKVFLASPASQQINTSLLNFEE